MEETIEAKYYRGKSILPYENLDEQFEDWVNWLKSVEPSLHRSELARTPERRMALEGSRRRKRRSCLTTLINKTFTYLPHSRSSK